MKPSRSRRLDSVVCTPVARSPRARNRLDRFSCLTLLCSPWPPTLPDVTSATPPGAALPTSSPRSWRFLDRSHPASERTPSAAHCPDRFPHLLPNDRQTLQLSSAAFSALTIISSWHLRNCRMSSLSLAHYAARCALTIHLDAIGAVLIRIPVGSRRARCSQ
jgi:hypothetical protein